MAIHKNPKVEIKKPREYAKNTLQKDKRINIRMSSKDLDRVQVIAAQEGIPYQTLISVLFINMFQDICWKKRGFNNAFISHLLTESLAKRREPHSAPQFPPLGAGSKHTNANTSSTLEVEESPPFKEGDSSTIPPRTQKDRQSCAAAPPHPRLAGGL